VLGPSVGLVVSYDILSLLIGGGWEYFSLLVFIGKVSSVTLYTCEHAVSSLPDPPEIFAGATFLIPGSRSFTPIR